MRYMKKYTSLTLLTLLVMLAGACSKDTPMESRAESANITVNIASRGQIDTDNSEVKDHEGIKTLRLIMVQEGKVAGNWLREYNDNSLIQTFRILGVKAVDTQLYAIVNENGVNLNYATTFQVGSTFNASTYNNGAALAAIDVATNGIPMEGSTQITAAQMVEETSVSISVTRALARIDLTVNNKTGGNLSINEINFGPFFPVAGYLMKGQGGTVQNQTKDFTGDQTIVTNGTHTFTYYLFESSGGTYTVGMKGSTNYDPAQIYDKDTKPIASIERNQILKIDANANPTGWELRCEVAPWTLKEHEVNYIDQLSYSSHGWVPGTIAGRQENTVELSPDKEAELKFVIQAPNGVTRWIAELDDNTNFELVTEEGTTIFNNGQPIEQILKVKVAPNATDPAATTKLHVYAVVGSAAQYELDLTDSKGTADLNNFILKRAGGQ